MENEAEARIVALEERVRKLEYLMADYHSDVENVTPELVELRATLREQSKVKCPKCGTEFSETVIKYGMARQSYDVRCGSCGTVSEIHRIYHRRDRPK